MTQRCTHIPSGASAARAAALTAMVPVLETPRLILRGATISDLPAWNALLVPDDIGHLGGPHTEEEAWEAFCVYVAGWSLHGHGLWTVTTKTDAKVIGFVLVGLEWGDAEPELGWMVLPEARRQGYATEAVKAARDWGFDEGGFSTLVSYMHPDNLRSIALAERLHARSGADNPHPVPGALAYRHQVAQ